MLMRAHDWTRSSLGAPGEWSPALKTVVQILLNSGHPMYVCWGADGACLYNDAYRRSIGPERHPGSLGLPARQVWDEIWDEIGPQIAQVMSGGEPTWHENALIPITRNGRRDDVYWTYGYSPIGDAAMPNGVGGVLVVCNETTAMVDTQQRLLAERERLARLFDRAPSFLAIMSGPKHRFELVNASYVRLIGGRDVIGMEIAVVLTEAVDQGYVALLDGVYRSGKAFNSTGARFAIAPGPGEPAVDRYLDFVYEPVRDDDGTVTGVFCEGHDVTEAYVAQQKLLALTAELQGRVELAVRASEAALIRLHEARRLDTIGELTGGVAHDFNNLLTPILGGLDLLTRKLGGEPRLQRTAGLALEAAERARVLVQRLLAFGRRQTLQSRAVDLEALINGARVSFERAVGTTIAVTIDVAANLPPVEIDPAQLELALLNLGLNARDAMPGGGTLAIVVRRSGDDVAVRVADTGHGMAPETLARAIEPFFTTKAIGQGTGLGLSMVQGLVAQSGGMLTLTSQPGAGTTVELRLPVAVTAAVAATPALGSVPDGTGAVILLVDDEELVRMSIADGLRDAGYTVVEASSAATALAYLHGGGIPDALVTDYLMPGMTGTALAAEVRRSLPGLPILLITGYANLEPDEARGLEVMAKPFRQHDVVARLRALIDRSSTLHATAAS